MTFAEADAQYELVKQRFLTGDLSEDQYDEQLRDLMVLDDAGRWWAKSRENGIWHYYDTGSETWTTAVPPLVNVSAAPALTPDWQATPALEHTAPEPGQTEAIAVEPDTPVFKPEAGKSITAPEWLAAEPPREPAASAPAPSEQRSLPKWAAVAPPLAAPDAPGSVGQTGRPNAAAGHAADPVAPAVGYSAHDFAPLPDLSGGLKIVFSILSFLVPLLGLVLFVVYRKKPAPSDRAAARLFLILGVVSLVLYGLCGVLLVVAEAALLGAGA